MEHICKFPFNDNYQNYFTMIAPFHSEKDLAKLSVLCKSIHIKYLKKRNAKIICQWFLKKILYKPCTYEQCIKKSTKSTILLLYYYEYPWMLYKTYIQFLIKKCKLQNIVTIPQHIVDNPTRNDITKFMFNCEHITIEHILYTGW
jgi:hypothetical protein